MSVCTVSKLMLLNILAPGGARLQRRPVYETRPKSGQKSISCERIIIARCR